MQATELDAQAPVSAYFGRHYAASNAFCSRARRDVGAVLADLGLTEDGVFAGEVVASELFANALLHHSVQTSEQVHVEVLMSPNGAGQWVGIAVTDSGRGAVKPAKDVAPERADFGHGLEVVRGFGARLTDARLPGGYTVTAWVPALDGLRQRVCRCDCASVHGPEPSACSWLIEDWEAQDDARRAEDPMAHLCIGCRALLLKAIAESRAASRAREVMQ